MTRRRNSRIFTPFANLKRQFRARKENTLISVYNIFSFYESESSESKSEEMGEVGIETLTTKHYLDLTRGNQRVGVVIPEICGNVNSKIKGQFLRELRDNTFFGNKNEDAYEHVEKKDGKSAFYNNNTWELLKRAFILRYCPPSRTAKQLELIHNLKEEGDETLYQVQERYNDLLFKFPTHDLNDYKKVSIFYKGLDIPTRQMYDRGCNRELGGSSSDGMGVITIKLNDLGRDLRKLKESMHAIQFAKHPIAPSGSYPKAYNHPLLDKRPSLEETIGKYFDESSKMQEAYEEWMKRLRESTNKSFKKHDSAIKNLETNGQAIGPSSPYFYDQRIKVMFIVHLFCLILLSRKKSKKVGEDDESPRPTPIIGTQKEPGTFAENVKRRIVDEQENIILESLEKLLFNTPLSDTLRQNTDYTKSLQEIMSKKKRTEELSVIKLNVGGSTVLQNELPPKEKDPMNFILPCIIGSMTVSNALADLGASMNVMPFSMFKRLGLVDIIIREIVNDDKVPIILGRLMLATSHARNDVFRKKILLEAEGENVPNDFVAQENLEEFLMNNEINRESRDFLEFNDILPENDMEPFGVLLDSESEMGIGLDDFSGDL
ncbi:hypothetical protein Tco_0805387 [Tanacetum coccineum]